VNRSSDEFPAGDWLAALRLVASHYGVSTDQSARFNALDDAVATGDDRVRNIARRLGLRATFSEPQGLRLSALHLPLAIETGAHGVVLVNSLSDGAAFVAFAANPGIESRMTLDDLVADARRVVHARPAKLIGDERVDAYIQPYEENWLRRILTRDIGAYGNVLLASLVSNTLALAGILFSMQVYDRVLPTGSYPTLLVLFIGVVFAIILDFLLRRMRLSIIDVVGKRADRRMSDAVFGHALRVKSRARPNSTGSFIAQLRDLEQVREVLGSTTIAAIADLPFFFLFLAILWFIAGSLVLVPIGAMMLLLVPGLLAQRRLRVHATEAMREASLRNAMLVEAVQGIEDIKTLQAEDHFQRQWNHYTAATAEAQLKLRGLANSLTVWTHNVQMGVYATTVFVGAPMVISGDITTGVLVGASVLGSRMLAPMAQLTQVLSRLQQARIGASSLDRIMSLPVDHPDDESRIALPAVEGRFTLREAQFRYGDANAPVALGVKALNIAPGERIAVLGRNGAGKSTMLQALSGLLEPASGEVLLDGIALSQVDPADIRHTIALLTQNARLFHGTIRDNLTLGAPTATDAELLQAVSMVGADQFIRTLQRGMEHPIQEGGAGLSGGQVQALLLARLLLRDPTVLLLDEPTASMDEAAERNFIERLAEWSKGRTLIVATHRTRVLDLVDRVLIVERGQLVRDESKVRFLALHKGGQGSAKGEKQVGDAA
jgi:ATP-binding cassette subfamily C protein LapB